PSPSMAEVLRSHGIESGLRLWSRGVDTSRFNPSRRSNEWRRSMGVGDDEILVSFIGRLVWEKGLRVFADVIQNVEQRGIPHRSMIVGEGPALTELRERLPSTLFTGYLEGTALARAYASSDVFLFPSDTETFGNVTLEAMASGVPTVCADATGSRTLVVHGETGLLVPAGNSAAFTEAGRDLRGAHAERGRRGGDAPLRGRQYDWDTVLMHIVRWYDEIIEPGVDCPGDGFMQDLPVPLAKPATPPLLSQLTS